MLKDTERMMHDRGKKVGRLNIMSAIMTSVCRLLLYSVYPFGSSLFRRNFQFIYLSLASFVTRSVNQRPIVGQTVTVSRRVCAPLSLPKTQPHTPDRADD